jgi:DNA invertase Pin-like site-specific DNA recombinase
MKLAIGYLRVSGRTQFTDGTGLDEQRAQIMAWAATRGFEMIEWFTDGVTGELPWHKRPGMAALVERVSAKDLDAVIVHQLDRIGRGKSAIFEDFLSIAGAAVAVWSVVDGLLTSDTSLDEFQNADKDMILGIKMQIVRNEKRKLVARMKLGKLRAASYARQSRDGTSTESTRMACIPKGPKRKPHWPGCDRWAMQNGGVMTTLLRL